MMYSSMATSVNGFDSAELLRTGIIAWSCPVPFFGDIENARLATVGINPSNREFLAEDGEELVGVNRRLPTLSSLQRSSWLDVEAVQIQELVQHCSTYFLRSPYDRWFQVLERLLTPTGYSLYAKAGGACHLDLVPYATENKWGSLSSSAQRALLAASKDALARLLRDAQLNTLVLNGQSVVREFQRLTEVNLSCTPVSPWNLPRAGGQDVKGYSYVGEVSRIAGFDLGSLVTVLGYNHNLQSSYGVTGEVVSAIGDWLARTMKE
jgi:hypothetical protein